MMFDETFIKEMSSIDAYNYGRQKAEKELNEIHLCECNQIRAEAYQQGAREFAEWIFKSKYREINMDSFSWYDDKGIDRLESLDNVLAEWQKGKEND